MSQDDFFYFGKVLRPKGFKGELRISLDVDDPSDYSELSMIFVERKRELIPMFITSWIIEGNKAAVKLEGIEDEESAEKLQGCKLFLPMEVLPPLEGDKFYYHEVIGFEIIDDKHGAIGTLKNVIDLPSNPLFEIDNKGKELLIPIQDDIIKKVDRENKTILVSAPEGLIDIYLE
jgi:16S rRNA processing protein RimM